MTRAPKKKAAAVSVTRDQRINHFSNTKEIKGKVKSVLLQFESKGAARQHMATLFENKSVAKLHQWNKFIILQYHKQHMFPALKTKLTLQNIPFLKIGTFGLRDINIWLKDIQPKLTRDTIVPPKPSEDPDDGFQWILTDNTWRQRPWCDPCNQWKSVCIHGRDNVRHYVTHILASMRSSSMVRHHPFHVKIACAKLINGIRRIPEENICPCGRPDCIELKPVMVLDGQHKISPDRANNSTGYSHPTTWITFISKLHNVRTKHDSDTLKPRTQRAGFFSVTVSSMVQRTKDRIETALQSQQILSQTKLHSIERYKLIQDNLKEIYKQQLVAARVDNCTKCGHELDYGDENDILTYKNNPHQASPDRIDNEILLYVDNFRMTCTCCNDIERGTTRSGMEIALTSEVKQEIITRLQGIIEGTIQPPCRDFIPAENREASLVDP
jgi:hypothetical protein